MTLDIADLDLLPAREADPEPTASELGLAQCTHTCGETCEVTCDHTWH
jgi:hypothetical protein